MRRLLLVFLLPLAAFADWASTVNDSTKTGTTDGSQSDTQTAFNYVDAKNQDGWVISIAAGSFSWTAAANMAATMVHSYTVQGVGGNGNRTTITASGSISGQLFGMVATAGKLTKVQYLNFAGAGKTFGSGMVVVDNTGSATSTNSYWFENCNFSDASLMFQVLGPDRNNAGACFGLVDLCVFTVVGSQSGVYVNVGNSDDQWNGDMLWGTIYTCTFEDCTFTQSSGNTVEGNPAIDSRYRGARWMLRYSTLTNVSLVCHGADSAPQSTLQVELLHNAFNYVTNDGVDFSMYLRGGSMRYTGNTVTLTNGATLNQIIKTAIDGDGSGGPSVTHSPAPFAGDWFQQPGHGPVAGGEVRVPVYVWSNTLPGGVTVVGAPTNHAAEFVLNTHYFLSDPGDYVELVYPHPLRGAGAPSSTASMTGAASISGNASIK